MPQVLPHDYPPENVVVDPTGNYAFLTDDNQSALAMAVGTVAYEYVEPPAVNATGATAGSPGTWTPADSVPPATANDMSGIVATPTTPWQPGEYCQTQTPLEPGRVHWNGTAWAQGTAP